VALEDIVIIKSSHRGGTRMYQPKLEKEIIHRKCHIARSVIIIQILWIEILYKNA
jgi:hypothetical protein